MLGKLIDQELEFMDGCFSIILKDLTKNEVLYARDLDRQLPSASTIKVLIMVEAFRRMLKGCLDMKEKLRVKKEDKVSFSLITEMKEEEYAIGDLITLMMTISDNTAANLLIDRLGMDPINETAWSIGLSNTALRRKMMDLDAVKAGRQNMTSPKDMQLIFEKLYRNAILTPDACREMLDIMSIVIRKDGLIRDLPVEVRVARKTGELDNLNHDIGIFFMGSVDYLLGVFATGLKDNVEGSEYIARLSKIIFSHLTEVKEETE